ncbi:hypothetical protein NPIL_128611 [Nephila pilipes]|uniref:Uncharacterized protein n=1 Tax=Nephila pilipes TaxID=299642 RepID=A0A8X6NW03_NEPPI|nr:hypothetical protein NPIL_128611 [Nephila pilipes]
MQPYFSVDRLYQKRFATFIRGSLTTAKNCSRSREKVPDTGKGNSTESSSKQENTTGYGCRVRFNPKYKSRNRWWGLTVTVVERQKKNSVQDLRTKRSRKCCCTKVIKVSVILAPYLGQANV